MVAKVEGEQHEFGHRLRRKRVGPPRARVEVPQARDDVVPERLMAAGAQEVLDCGTRILQEIANHAQQAHAGHDQRRAPVLRRA